MRKILYCYRYGFGCIGATAGPNKAQSESSIFHHLFEHLGPYFGYNPANIVCQVIHCIWFIAVNYERTRDDRQERICVDWALQLQKVDAFSTSRVMVISKVTANGTKKIHVWSPRYRSNYIYMTVFLRNQIFVFFYYFLVFCFSIGLIVTFYSWMAALVKWYFFTV